MDLRAGRTLVEGRYTLVRELGRGATGHVWEARHGGDGRSVALKCMPAEAGGRAAAEREAEVAVRVKHPAVVRIQLTHEEDGLAIVVMERCTGSLGSRVTLDGPLAPEEALAAMIPVVEALGAAHAVGVIHRDVKPQNVLVRDDGSIALGDWGIARALFGGGGATTTSLAVLGTLPYLAPELRKDARAAAPASDLYAAGITLAWLCLGEAPSDPFMSEGEDELRRLLPGPFVEVVLRACAWSASARYANALEMTTALRAARAAPRVPPASAHAPASAQVRAVPPARVGGAGRNVTVPGGAGGAGTPRGGQGLVALGGIAALLAAGVSAWTVGRGGAGGSASPTEPTGASASALPPCEVTVRDFLPQRALGPEETIAAAVDDLDGDGAPDVIFSNQAAESLTLWWGRAGGMPVRGEDLAVGRVSGTVAVLDVDGDGTNDLVVPHRDDAAFGVHRGLGGRAFEAGVRVFQGPAPGNAATVPSGDASAPRAVVFDADGFLHRRDTAGAPRGSAGGAVGDGAWGAHRLIAQEETAGAPSVFTQAGRAWATLRTAQGWELRAASGDIETAATLDLPEAVARARFVVPWWEAGGARSVAAFVDESVVRVELDAEGAPRACRVGPWRALDPASPAAVADLDGDGAPDVVATLTCSGCTSNQMLARGVR